MAVPVKLSDVVEQLSIVSDDTDVYFNRRTGEFVMLSSDDMLGFEDEDDFAEAEDDDVFAEVEHDDGLQGAEEDDDVGETEGLDDPDWLKSVAEERRQEQKLRQEISNSDDYTALPDKFDIHDWQIMHDFCAAQSDRIRDDLLGLIRGGGAFRRFNNFVDRSGLDRKWLQFRQQAYEEIARQWLEFNGIEFIDDCRLSIADSKKRHATDSTHGMQPRTEPSQRSDVRVSSERRPRSVAPPQVEAKPVDSSTKSDEIKVFISHQNSHCGECDEDLGKKAWITLERDKGALCLACADLDELVFLPAGDAALTRRSRKYSNLSAVVLKFSKARNRYERQGLLVEESAIERAEAECLADSEIRERRNERERERRAEIDEEYVKAFAKHVRETFPNCPKGREDAIAEHACLKYSGRVGRSAAAKEFDEEMIALAVRAHVRHRETNYDQLLGRGCARHEARAVVRDRVEEIVESWS